MTLSIQTARFGRDPLRVELADCEVRRYRGGTVLAIGAPAPSDLLAAPRVIAVGNLKDAAAFTAREILKGARAGLVYVCNSITLARSIEADLHFAGAKI